MEIRVLRYFLTVVREESITKASEVLHFGYFLTYHAADTFTSACTDGGRYWCKAV